jgi:uncharacterized protein
MAQNLHYTGTLLDKGEWKDIAKSMTNSLADLIKSEPNYMSQWGIVYAELNKGMKEVILTGDGIHGLRAELQKEFYPFVLLQGSTSGSDLPLFEGKVAVQGKDTIYVCYQKTCNLPVFSLEDAKKQF